MAPAAEHAGLVDYHLTTDASCLVKGNREKTYGRDYLQSLAAIDTYHKRKMLMKMKNPDQEKLKC